MLRLHGGVRGPGAGLNDVLDAHPALVEDGEGVEPRRQVPALELPLDHLTLVRFQRVEGVHEPGIQLDGEGDPDAAGIMRVRELLVDVSPAAFQVVIDLLFDPIDELGHRPESVLYPGRVQLFQTFSIQGHRVLRVCDGIIGARAVFRPGILGHRAGNVKAGPLAVLRAGTGGGPGHLAMGQHERERHALVGAVRLAGHIVCAATPGRTVRSGVPNEIMDLPGAMRHLGAETVGYGDPPTDRHALCNPWNRERP